MVDIFNQAIFVTYIGVAAESKGVFEQLIAAMRKLCMVLNKVIQLDSLGPHHKAIQLRHLTEHHTQIITAIC